MRHPCRGCATPPGVRPPAGVRPPCRGAPLKGWRQGCATPPGARHPPGWRHPCRVAPPLQGWRTPEGVASACVKPPQSSSGRSRPGAKRRGPCGVSAPRREAPGPLRRFLLTSPRSVNRRTAPQFFQNSRFPMSANDKKNLTTVNFSAAELTSREKCGCFEV